MQIMLIAIQLASAGFALLAAYFWWMSGQNMPDRRPASEMTDKMAEDGALAVSAMDGEDLFIYNLPKQSQHSRRAALSAAVAAVLQAIAIAVPVFA